MTAAESAVRRPVVVDTALAELHGQVAVLLHRRDGLADSAHRMLGERPTYVGRQPKWTSTAAEAFTALAGSLDTLPKHEQRNAATLLAHVETTDLELAEARQAMRPLNAEYAAAPWNRYFLVTSSAGHIHSSTGCSTCGAKTAFAWLPDLSGLGEQAAVDAHGALLCSVCWPSAPVAWTNGREVEAAARQAGRCAGGAATGRRRRGMTVYGTCPTCQSTQTVLTSGLVRAHKTPAAEVAARPSRANVQHQPAEEPTVPRKPRTQLAVVPDAPEPAGDPAPDPGGQAGAYGADDPQPNPVESTPGPAAGERYPCPTCGRRGVVKADGLTVGSHKNPGGEGRCPGGTIT